MNYRENAAGKIIELAEKLVKQYELKEKHSVEITITDDELAENN